MSIERINDVRSGKPFSPLDIVIYVLILVASLTFVFVTCVPRGEMRTVYAEVGGAGVFAYDCASGMLDVSNDFADRVTVTQVGSSKHVKITFGEEYNVVVLTEKEAYVAEATCSFSHDCTYSAHITKAGDSIICVPHALIIYADGVNLTPEIG